MRTKHEESSAIPDVSPRNSPSLPTTTPPTSPQARPRRSEIRCLQDLGDLRQLSTSHSCPLLRDSDPDGAIAGFLDVTLSAVVQETMAWARQYEADGRYRDAEYLFRRVSSDRNISMESVDLYQSEDVLPTLVSVYERMGDYPAAEMAQETLLRRLFAENPKQFSGEQIREVNAYSRLLSYFRKRILDFPAGGRMPFPAYIDLSITHRAAVLDIVPLNEALLEQGLIPLDHVAPFYTSLHIAVKENALNLVRLLISKGVVLESISIESDRPLHIASKFGTIPMIELLLHHGADTAARDNYGSTPLHRALTGRPTEQQELILSIVTILIDAKANTEARDWLGTTALHAAIHQDMQKVARYLLERGANVEASDYRGDTLLLAAVKNKREWAIKLLLEKKAQGDTALYVAVNQGQESIIQTLLDHGAMTRTTVDEQNSHEDTVLHCAVSAANVAVIEMLLKAGADIYGRDCFGNTALHAAIREGREFIVQLLLDFDATQMNSVNFTGDTVLHFAVVLPRRRMIPILLRHIKPDKLPIICQMRNNRGQTPLDLARTLADGGKEYSDERSILYLLENALKLSHSFIENKN